MNLGVFDKSFNPRLFIFLPDSSWQLSSGDDSNTGIRRMNKFSRDTALVSGAEQ